jgi:hypothetical protein
MSICAGAQKLALWFAASVVLAACGGSGSGTDSPPDPDTSVSTNAPDSPADRLQADAATKALPWNACVPENQVCNFSGTKRVRYGSGATWVEGVFTGTVNCNNATFGDPLKATFKSCQTQDIEWAACVAENQTCTFSGRRLVRYGAADKWVVREYTNSVACNNATFGDPLKGTFKSCLTAALKSTADTPPPPPAPAATVDAWSNPATWGGTVPPAGATVIIPAGKTVRLDTKVKVKGLTVNGTLACSGNDIAIEADWVMVSGNGAKLSCGSKAAPYLGRFNLLLVGPKTDNIMGMGARVLGAMDGGTIELFGEPRTGWTKLDATARSGTNTLTLAGVPTGWRAGMDIVIGSSDENPRHAEVRRIQAINGRVVTLASALEFSHFGEQQSYSSGSIDHVVDTRAPVGLLSRNITVQGGADSASTQFGGHMMTMASAKAYVSDVGLYRMGQKSLIGRYPFHWHLAGDVAGQFITRSSVWESYNRCITVHGSDNALVQDNVCYNHLGHGYFLEDGNEQGNTIKGNLGILTVKPNKGENILTSDINGDPASPGPATFWITNAKNTVVDNFAAGSDGGAYWLFLKKQDIKRYDGTSVNPRSTNLTRFDNNVASSSKMGYSSCPEEGGVFGFTPPTVPTINNFTAFMISDTGIWPCGSKQRFVGLKLLDAGSSSAEKSADGRMAGFTAPNDMELANSLFVANSGLTAISGRKKGRNAIGHYDQGFYIHDTHFVGYTKADNSQWMRFSGGAVKNSNNRVERITFEPKQTSAWSESRYNNPGAYNIWSAVHDVDGSLGIGANTVLLPAAPIHEGLGCASSSATIASDSMALICPGRIAVARIQLDSGEQGDFEVLRIATNGTIEARQSFGKDGVLRVNQSFLIPNDANRHSAIRFVQEPPNFMLYVADAWPNDLIRYELRGVNGSTRITSADFTQVDSLAALEASGTPAWFRSGNTIHLRFRMAANAERWLAERYITFAR